MAGFAYGVDLGWVSQLEQEGFSWMDVNGNKIDPILAAKNCGADSARFRVFVDPPLEARWTKKDGSTCILGRCSPLDVLEVSKRAKALDMRIMIDFHYSDHFADPQYQDIPTAWLNDTIAELRNHVYMHTKEVLELLKENDIEPEWVQVGNEVNTGLLLPHGSFKENPQEMVNLLNMGYLAAKDVFPQCNVVTHLSAAHRPDLIETYFDRFFALGGKTDIIGLSHYPYWFNMYALRTGGDPVESSAEYLLNLLDRYNKRYSLPIMICEVGELDSEVEQSYSLVSNTISALKALPTNQGAGVFYWEPEVNSAILPDQYPLGAATYLGNHTLQYTKALCAYCENKK